MGGLPFCSIVKEQLIHPLKRGGRYPPQADCMGWVGGTETVCIYCTIKLHGFAKRRFLLVLFFLKEKYISIPYAKSEGFQLTVSVDETSLHRSFKITCCCKVKSLKNSCYFL